MHRAVLSGLGNTNINKICSQTLAIRENLIILKHYNANTLVK